MFNAYVTGSLFFRTKHFDINLKLEYKQLSNVNFTIIFTCQRIENHVKLLDWIFLMGFCRAKEDKNPVCKMVHIFCLADIPHGSTQTLGKYFCVESLYVCTGQGPTTNRSKAVSEVYDLQSNLQKKKICKKTLLFFKGRFSLHWGCYRRTLALRLSVFLQGWWRLYYSPTALEWLGEGITASVGQKSHHQTSNSSALPTLRPCHFFTIPCKSLFFSSRTESWRSACVLVKISARKMPLLKKITSWERPWQHKHLFCQNTFILDGWVVQMAMNT